MMTATSSTPGLAALSPSSELPDIWSTFSCTVDTPRDPNSRTLSKLHSRVNKCLKKRKKSRESLI